MLRTHGVLVPRVTENGATSRHRFSELLNLFRTRFSQVARFQFAYGISGRGSADVPVLILCTHAPRDTLGLQKHLQLLMNCERRAQ